MNPVSHRSARLCSRIVALRASSQTLVSQPVSILGTHLGESARRGSFEHKPEAHSIVTMNPDRGPLRLKRPARFNNIEKMCRAWQGSFAIGSSDLASPLFPQRPVTRSAEVAAQPRSHRPRCIQWRCHLARFSGSRKVTTLRLRIRFTAQPRPTERISRLPTIDDNKRIADDGNSR